MYLDYYNLHLKPFQISTDPRFLWLGEKHDEALAILKYAIYDNKGFLLLTGDVGTGKTTLLNALIESLGDEVLVALVTDPGLSKLDFFNYVVDAFELDRTFRSKGQFLIFMKKFLNEVHRQNKQVLLIIDECQNLTQKMLEEVRLLSNIEKATTKLINIFFVGQIEFNDIILKPRNRAICQRITVNYNISALSETEIGDYIRHRLSVAGSDVPIFNPDAIKQVYEFSGGHPRLINIICDQALLSGYVNDEKIIGQAIVQGCISELEISKRGPIDSGSDQLEPDVRKPPEPLEAEPASTTVKRRWTFLFNPQLRHLQILAFAAVLVFFLVLQIAFFRNRNTSDTIETQTEAPQLSEARASNTIETQTEASQPSEVRATTQKTISSNPEPVPDESSPPADMTDPKIRTKSDTTVEATVNQLPEDATSAARAITIDASETEPSISLDNIQKRYGEYPEIQFDFNSNKLDREGYELLSLIARYIHQQPETVVVLWGYTDRSGVRRYNIKLAEFRADMVKAYLVGKGVREEAITTRAIGPDAEGPNGTTVPYDGERRKVVIEFISPVG